MRKPLSMLLLLNMIAAGSVFAAQQDVTVIGSTETVVPLQPHLMLSSKRSTSFNVIFKKIRLQKLQLSQAAQQKLAAQFNSDTASFSAAAPAGTLPPAASLSMANYPVLDQGQHGTCVTFADTGVLDAAVLKPDYISQLCNLELGKTLAKDDTNYPSGWDGSTNELVLQQIDKYGIVTMSYQKQYSCASRFEYPLDNEQDTGVPMSIDMFKRHSEMILRYMSYKVLLSTAESFTNTGKRSELLNAVKQSIVNGHRLVIGMLVDTNYHNVGAFGKYKVPQDSWIITPDIKKDAKNGAIHDGHAVIITGYDDNAVIAGPNKTKQVGVLTLRNSWSDKAGDHGDYYMSYDYFTKLATELVEVSPTPLH